jgi:predicted TIM-barrel fold metal-dependent hydrolase
MIIDAHGHLWRDDIVGSKAKVLRLCGRYGVGKVFISTLREDAYQPDEEEIRASNDATAAFMLEAPGLVEGMAYVNPRNPGALAEAERGILRLGMRGIKLWVAAYCDDPLVDPIADLAIDLGVPILIHTFYKANGMLPYESRAYHAANLARRRPKLSILMAHIGANVYDAVRCIKDCPNISVDISGSIYRRDDLVYTVRHIGADRILFGSDMPGSFESCFGQVMGAKLSDYQRERIFWRNAVDFFGLEGVEGGAS